MDAQAPHGLLPAIATPVDADGAPDAARAVAHCKRLLADGCDGANVLGTTGAFACFSVAQRIALMEAYASSELPVASMLVGTGASSLADALELTTRAVALAFGGALVIPPFYYKGVSDDAVFSFYARLIDDVGDARLRVYLYNFPQLSGVPFSRPLVERLVVAYPSTVVGMKDSAGDADLEAALSRALPSFAIFPSSEAHLLAARRNGYAGCISATLNVTASLAARVWRDPDGADAEALQRDLAARRAAFERVPMIAAVHDVLAERYGDERWRDLVPPLEPLTEAERARLGDAGREPSATW